MKHKKTIKKSSEKQFIKTMIITGVIGLSIMMITMLYVIKIFGSKKVNTPPKELLTETITPKSVPVSTTINGVVHGTLQEGKNIKIWDIKQEEYINIVIANETEIKDSYGKPMTAREIQVGEIMEVTYDIDTKIAVTIRKNTIAWTKTGVNGAEINHTNETITIGNEIYSYTSNLIVNNEEMETIKINTIGEHDTLTLKGMDKTVWSITITQSPGYIKVFNSPVEEGSIEIDNNRIYSLEEINESIPLPAGEHKVVIKLRGYEPIVENVNITKDAVYNIDLKDAKQTISNLSINVVNTAKEYTAQIDNKRYKKGEIIKLPSGEYTLRITAKDFETFEQKVNLESGDQLIDVILQPKNDSPENKKDNDKKDETEKPKQNKTVQIIIETEPEGAQVYINGVHKGITPTLTGLKAGEYSVSIEKSGYSSLNTIIVVDDSNAQRAFLYTLQKE